MQALLPAGVALAPVVLGTAAAFAGYTAWAHRFVRPTPRSVRSLIDA